MTTDATVRETVEAAAESVGRAWPLHSFVTANPLAGFEDQAFPHAVREARRLFGGQGYPSPEVFRRALDQGRIDRALLDAELDEHGFDADPDDLLDRAGERRQRQRPDRCDGRERLDRLVAKWVAAFLDEGRANWPMPEREHGFYAAFRAVAQHDDQIPHRDELSFPPDPTDAIETALDGLDRDRWTRILEHHLASLHGWTGLAKRRQDADDAWQNAAPIDLVDYAAVRLTLADHLGAPLEPPEHEPAEPTDESPIEEAFLSAWEQTYRSDLVAEVRTAARGLPTEPEASPDTQLAFCIDTRSEVLRRHLEDIGDHETHGYAGFFGVPMRYRGLDADRSYDACPPIVDPQHSVHERPTGENPQAEERHGSRTRLVDAARSMIGSLKRNPATAFPFVEHTGAAYGVALTARTLVPGSVRTFLDRLGTSVPETERFAEPTIDPTEDLGIPFEAQVDYAANAFELMGIDEFAPVFVFVGHAAETVNNPFDSALDCGACAGNPGGPNARTLAAICNREPVRDALAERGIPIPDDTVFLAGEHNTTTDEVTLYRTDRARTHADVVDELEADLAEAGPRTAAERLGIADPENAASQASRRAGDWSQTRSEWGLAGNACFVIARREIPANLDLDGRAFLHSYDWRADDGDALEAILTGPMVVTEWINLQYYFASVDNQTWGSGSKITQSPIGNVATVQGNGGDAATGLPKESLFDVDGQLYHQPIRLSTVVEAPIQRVEAILDEHENLDQLVANGWLSLTVVDPTRAHSAFEYQGQARWSPPLEAEATPTSETVQPQTASQSASTP